MNYYCPINKAKVALKTQNDWPTPLSINGFDYCFLHLQPYDQILSRPASGHHLALSISIRVVFDCHVATKSAVPPPPAISILNAEGFWVGSGVKLRIFDAGRYQESLNLRMVLQEVFDGKRKCFQGAKNNSFIWNRTLANGVAENYQIYFTITGTIAGGALMYVQSAFVRIDPTYSPRETETFIGLYRKALNHKR